MGHILVHNTHGKDDVERASLAFLIGNTALISGQEATVLLTVERFKVPGSRFTVQNQEPETRNQEPETRKWKGFGWPKRATSMASRPRPSLR